MLIPTKKYYLLFSLLLLNLYTINSFSSQNTFTSQSYTNYQQSQLLNDYLIRLQQKLNGLPNDEIVEIINQTKIELKHIDLRHRITVELTIRSILIAHVENKINREIYAYETQKDIKFDQDIHELIKANRLQAFINRLSELPIITGKDIRGFFGDYRKDAIQKVCDTAAGKQKARQNPFPSAPPAPLHNAYKAQKHAEEFDEAIKKMNKNNASDYLFKKDADDLKKIILSNNSEDNALENIKKSLLSFLDEKLAKEEEELKKEGSYSLSDIQNATDKTRVQKRKDIKQLKEINASKIAGMIGNNKDGSSNIKTAVHNNLQKNRR